MGNLPVSSTNNLDVASQFTQLNSGPSGLTQQVASERLANQVVPKSEASGAWKNLLLQFANPIQLLLIVAAILSGTLGEFTDCAIIVFILVVSGLLSFIQEFKAGNAVALLMKLVATQSEVIRDGESRNVPLAEVVPGDVVVLSAGSLIPGDGFVFEEDSLFVDQAALTGESFPVEKSTNPSENGVFAGTHVVSGTAKALIVKTGRETQLGGIATTLRTKRPGGDFQRGIWQLGVMLVQITIFLTLFVLMVNLVAHRPVLESFMFSLALAVGLTPQLLPAIVSINLSRGAMAMARSSVIVKKLTSIENFGSMNVLCSDKTGTLTRGMVNVVRGVDFHGQESQVVLETSQLNALFESGYVNPVDQALRESAQPGLTDGKTKLGELPYDFHRKRLSVLVESDGVKKLLMKGALTSVLESCTVANTFSGPVPLPPLEEQIEKDFQNYSEQGYRVLGVATRIVASNGSLRVEDEGGMTYEGMLLLEDPLRAESVETVEKLASYGIELKMITGDNRHVAARLGITLGLKFGILLGAEMDALTDEALLVRAKETSIFAEIEPRQKQRVILSLKQSGAVVGYIGDGINDGPALHAADVSISVANAVDVAKEAADFVMLKPDLGVLIGAVTEGRRTFTNTMKYIFMATSANFGNMFSLAGASLLVPFLPLLAKQVLLTNLLTDFPEMTIAGDNVDSEVLGKRQKWDLVFLRKFMLVFGLLSSVFDFATFGMLTWLKASPTLFRTAWFTESVMSASLIVLVFRSRRWAWRSRPSPSLLGTTLGICLLVLVLPATPLASPLGFESLPLPLTALVLGIVAAYVVSAELTKHWFFGKYS